MAMFNNRGTQTMYNILTVKRGHELSEFPYAMRGKVPLLCGKCIKQTQYDLKWKFCKTLIRRERERDAL